MISLGRRKNNSRRSARRFVRLVGAAFVCPDLLVFGRAFFFDAAPIPSEEVWMRISRSIQNPQEEFVIHDMTVRNMRVQTEAVAIEVPIYRPPAAPKPWPPAHPKSPRKRRTGETTLHSGRGRLRG